MLLHAAHASKNACQSVIVRSPDTDVALLCLYFAGEILKPLYFETGVKDSHRVIDVKAMATALGPDICKALPGLHALTGCDSTNSFHGKGKVSCYSRLSSDAECLEILSCLGVTFSFPAELLSKIEKVVCAVYESSSTSVGEARYAMFCAKGGWEKTYHLPRLPYCNMQCVRTTRLLSGRPRCSRMQRYLRLMAMVGASRRMKSVLLGLRNRQLLVIYWR